MNYVCDDKIILNIHGLRFTIKEDYASLSGKTEYHIRWEYKGVDGCFNYKENEFERNIMFGEIKKKLHTEGEDDG